jgi:hypothetical protein
MSNRFRPQVESLGDRAVPATFGNPWPSPNLTISFVPDGTDVHGAPSRLSQLFAGIPTDVWQGEILRAFQAWAVAANVNVGIVADGGQPLGAPGAPQGDARFGDIRIAAVPLAPDAAALAAPFDLTAGSRSGDVWFNSNLPFSVGGEAGNDVFTVALHEAGHVFGIPENDDPTSAMFDEAATRLGLNPGDVASVVALYGQRAPDAFDLARGNGTVGSSSNVRITSGKDSSTSGIWSADIGAGDVDVYNFRAEELVGGNLRAAVRVAGYSLLAPRLEILDASGRVIASGRAGLPGADVVLDLSGLTPGGTYYARVSPGRGDVFGVGGYRLELRSPAFQGDASGGGQLLNPETSANDTLSTASQLGGQFQTTAPQHPGYALAASLSSSADVDFYKLKTPQTANGAPVTMTVTVSTTPPDGTDPVVEVYDTRGNRVSFAVLVHDGGTFTVQVLSATANADYYVAVRHAHPGAGAKPGNYSLSIDFGTAPVQMPDFASGTLTAANPAALSVLAVNEAQVLHLVLDLGGNAPSLAAGVRVTVVGAAGAVVASQFVLAGDAVSLNLFLKPGTYGVLVGAGTLDGSALTSLRIALRGLTLSDPIGPQPVTTTTQPAGSPASAPTPSPQPVEPAPLTYTRRVGPVDPPPRGWGAAPPPDWTQAEWATLSGLLLLAASSPTQP